jgi:lipid-A-disaccharide synthase
MSALKVFITAGEISGDLLASQLMRSLKQLTPVSFSGVGGPRMTVEGLTSLFPIDDIAVMGLVDILPRAPQLLARIRQTAEECARQKPDVAVLVDAPGFNHRAAIIIRKLDPTIPIVIYVAPQVWAWRPGRAKNMPRYCDHVLALLPFEPAFFEKVGLKTTHVGHPVVERFPGKGLGAGFRARHDIADDATLLAVLPGSRHKEVARLEPIFAETLARLKTLHPKLVALVPTIPHVEAQVRDAAARWAVPSIVSAAEEDKYPAFEAAEAALAASGTVALELALAGTPMVIAYKLDALTAFYVRRVVTVPYANLINLIENRLVVPEFLQETCTADTLAPAVNRLLTDESARAAQQAAFAHAAKALGLGDEAPSLRAAKAVLSTVKKPLIAR